MLIGLQPAKAASQQGFMLLESLLALLIFSLGILGMVAINARAIQAATDAEFRTDAAKFADEIATQISLNADRTTTASLATSLANFAYSGGAPSSPVVEQWLIRLSGTSSSGVPSGVQNCQSPLVGRCWTELNTPLSTPLPGVLWANQRIVITTATGAFNRVDVTIQWNVPNGGPRQHSVVFYVN